MNKLIWLIPVFALVISGCTFLPQSIYEECKTGGVSDMISINSCEKCVDDCTNYNLQFTEHKFTLNTYECWCFNTDTKEAQRIW